MRTKWIALALMFFAAAAGAQEAGKQEKKKDQGLAPLLSAGIMAAKAFQPMTAEEERAVGRGVAREVFLRYGPPADNAALTRYVALVGQTVAARAGNVGPLKYAVVKSAEANAFAAPGGYLFITTGLIGALATEAQLAGVVAHEVAHVARGHMTEAVQRARQAQGVAGLAAVALDKDPRALARVVQMASDILFTHGIGHDMEYQADRDGTGYAATSGYAAAGLRDFLATLRGMEGKAPSVFFSTHPPTGERIARLERDVLPHHRAGGQTLEERFASVAK